MDVAYGNSCEDISCTHIELAILFGSVDMICYSKGRRIIEFKGPPAKKKAVHYCTAFFCVRCACEVNSVLKVVQCVSSDVALLFIPARPICALSPSVSNPSRSYHMNPPRVNSEWHQHYRPLCCYY